MAPIKVFFNGIRGGAKGGAPEIAINRNGKFELISDCAVLHNEQGHKNDYL